MRRTAMSLIVCLLLAAGQLHGQQTASTVEAASTTIKTLEEIYYNDIAIGERVLSQTTRPALIVRTDAPNPLRS